MKLEDHEEVKGNDKIGGNNLFKGPSSVLSG